MFGGWSQVAFSRDVHADLTAASIGSRPLVLVRQSQRVRAFDAACPHRGAHLAYGGSLEGNVIVCPFHGRRVSLGGEGGGPYRVREYPTVEASGGVFVLLLDGEENGFTQFIENLSRTHFTLSGFALNVSVSAEYVIENIFDIDHFRVVHAMSKAPTFGLRASRRGELAVEGVFEVPNPNPWQEDERTEAGVRTRFFARVFSPTLAATELGKEGRAPVVLTAATPTSEGSCVVRVTVAVPPAPNGAAPPLETALALVRDSRTAFQQDTPIWEHLCIGGASNLDARDWLVLEYREFCRRFLAEDARA